MVFIQDFMAETVNMNEYELQLVVLHPDHENVAFSPSRSAKLWLQSLPTCSAERFLLTGPNYLDQYVSTRLITFYTLDSVLRVNSVSVMRHISVYLLALNVTFKSGKPRLCHHWMHSQPVLASRLLHCYQKMV